MAVVGFWSTVGSPVVFFMAVFATELILLIASGVLLLAGLGLSIAGASRRDTSPTHMRLATAGVVIAVLLVCVSPFLLFWAAWVWVCC